MATKFDKYLGKIREEDAGGGGSTTVTGSDIYVAAEGTTAADWNGATLNTITVEQMAKDVYSCINSINAVPPNSDGTIVLTGFEIPIGSDSWDFESGSINGLSVGDVLSHFVRADESGHQYVSIDSSYVFSTSTGTAVSDSLSTLNDYKLGIPSGNRVPLSLGDNNIPPLDPLGDGSATTYPPGWLYIYLDITTNQEVDLSFNLLNYSGRIRRTVAGTDTFMYPYNSGQNVQIYLNDSTEIPEGVTCVIEFIYEVVANG